MAQYNFMDAIPFNEHPLYKKGYEDAVDKACLEYEKELRQMKRILNEVKDGAGEIICISGSLIQFRKAMEE